MDKTYLLPKGDSRFEIPKRCRLTLEEHPTDLYRGFVRDAENSLALYWRRRNPMAILGFEYRERGIWINQIQGKCGLPGMRPPKKWERMLLEAAINLAREQGLSEVQVQRAEKNKWYKTRWAMHEINEKTGKCKRQEGLKMRYDVTPKRRGFRLNEKGVWILQLATA